MGSKMKDECSSLYTNCCEVSGIVLLVKAMVDFTVVTKLNDLNGQVYDVVGTARYDMMLSTRVVLISGHSGLLGQRTFYISHGRGEAPSVQFQAAGISDGSSMVYFTSSNQPVPLSQITLRRFFQKIS